MSDLANIAPALVGALKELTNIAKGHEGGGGGKKYTYANIADLVAETRPVLAEHGLVALTPVHHQGNDLACSVVLLHESGERLDFGPATFPHGNDAQSTGSWITYMRRYCLLAALGMATEDDDGASARPADRRQERPQEPPPGKPVGQVKQQLVDYLTGRVPEGTEKDHAAQVWADAEVKVLDGKWVSPDEVRELMATATEHVDGLAVPA